jgi:hypothetical protein
MPAQVQVLSSLPGSSTTVTNYYKQNPRKLNATVYNAPAFVTSIAPGKISSRSRCAIDIGGVGRLMPPSTQNRSRYWSFQRRGRFGAMLLRYNGRSNLAAILPGELTNS